MAIKMNNATTRFFTEFSSLGELNVKSFAS